MTDSEKQIVREEQTVRIKITNNEITSAQIKNFLAADCNINAKVDLSEEVDGAYYYDVTYDKSAFLRELLLSKLNAITTKAASAAVLKDDSDDTIQIPYHSLVYNEKIYADEDFSAPLDNSLEEQTKVFLHNRVKQHTSYNKGLDTNYKQLKSMLNTLQPQDKEVVNAAGEIKYLVTNQLVKEIKRDSLKGVELKHYTLIKDTVQTTRVQSQINILDKELVETKNYISSRKTALWKSLSGITQIQFNSLMNLVTLVTTQDYYKSQIQGDLLLLSSYKYKVRNEVTYNLHMLEKINHDDDYNNSLYSGFIFNQALYSDAVFMEQQYSDFSEIVIIDQPADFDETALENQVSYITNRTLDGHPKSETVGEDLKKTFSPTEADGDDSSDSVKEISSFDVISDIADKIGAVAPKDFLVTSTELSTGVFSNDSVFGAISSGAEQEAASSKAHQTAGVVAATYAPMAAGVGLSVVATSTTKNTLTGAAKTATSFAAGAIGIVGAVAIMAIATSVMAALKFSTTIIIPARLRSSVSRIYIRVARIIHRKLYIKFRSLTTQAELITSKTTADTVTRYISGKEITSNTSIDEYITQNCSFNKLMYYGTRVRMRIGSVTATEYGHWASNKTGLSTEVFLVMYDRIFSTFDITLGCSPSYEAFLLGDAQEQGLIKLETVASFIKKGVMQFDMANTFVTVLGVREGGKEAFKITT